MQAGWNIKNPNPHHSGILTILPLKQGEIAVLLRVSWFFYSFPDGMTIYEKWFS